AAETGVFARRASGANGWASDPVGKARLRIFHATSYFFFFKQKTAYEFGLGIPAEPLFRSWTIRKRLPRCKMRLKKRLLAFSRRLHARIRKTRYMHKMRCLLINRRSLLLALRLLWKTPIFPSNSRFPRLCAKCLLKLKRLVSILPMTKSKK